MNIRNLTNSELKNLEFTPRTNYYALRDDCDDMYCDYEAVVDVARNYIEKCMKKYKQDFLWIKPTIHEEASFASLIFAYKNSIFAVRIIYHLNGEEVVEEDEEESEFLSVSTENNFTPCLLHVFIETSDTSTKIYVEPTNGLKFIHAKTKTEIDPVDIASDEPALMSEFELLHTAVKTIAGAMEYIGFRIESQSIISLSDRYPNIWFHDKNGRYCNVFVRYTHNLNDLREFNLNKFVYGVEPGTTYPNYIAPIFIGSENGKIYRNQVLNVSYFKDVILKISDGN